ncbi:AraC family transcriptional regulator [Pseudonocardia humida]|uniref:AraC family transcriptional regulator n=1 Tax=Pseudonocardia humida TaxID=2800819 RepID=A0ABT0ZS03_9PSEU|nr:helix-turn-helix domain-containing protein [Pseudonocardia humida]MCO1653489.1 AraC family transcriptional regulator [Pseudonocardia humida]
MPGPWDQEYVLGRPHRALAGLVLRYQGYREFSSTALRRRQPPAGSCTLILGLGPPLRLFGPAGPTAPTSFLAGMHDAAVITEFTGAQHGLQVDLTPLGTYTLLGRPMPELTNRVPRLDELDAPALAGLPERLAAEPDWPRRFARLDAALLTILDAARRRPDPEVGWAWRELARTAGAVGVARLAEETGWSRRHLLTRFRTQVGLAPKVAGRVLRFQRAAGLLVAGTGGTIADVAATCGYADHAHLDREFRALAGCTPSAFLAELS